MEREFSDEEHQIVRACMELNLSGYKFGRGLVGKAQEEETSNRAFDALMQAYIQIKHQAFVDGMAAAYLIAGRHDLIARIPEIERAAAVIMAERLKRKDTDDA